MTISMNAKKNKTGRRGAALLVVLLVIMAITIVSLGFLSRSDIELACGQNMVLRTQMDYLAESGLEHARGLILHPQDIDSEYWPGATAQQLLADSDDYYDVEVVRDDSDPTDRCNYVIDCDSYRLEAGERIGRSSVSAKLRLDPCVALWTGTNTTLWPGVTINGDVRCGGTLLNQGTIDGDVFASSLAGDGTVEGQQKEPNDLSLIWPNVTVGNFRYAAGVSYHSPDFTLTGDMRIDGMLLVEGDLMVRNAANAIAATKNLPALLVTGDLIIAGGGELTITGLAVVDGDVLISAGDAKITVVGGLFVQGMLAETTADSSDYGNTGTLYNGPTWQSSGGGALEFHGDNTAVQIGTNGMDPQNGSVCLRAYAYGFGSSHHYLFGHACPTSWWGNLIQLYTDDENGWLDLGLGSSHYRRTGIKRLDTNTWYDIALTWNGTQYTVYVRDSEGVVEVSGDYAGLWTLGNIADIGNRGVPTRRDGSFHGLIDDVRIYNRVLDPNDIPPTDGLAGLVGHWKLDEAGSNITVTAAPSKTAVVLWSEAGHTEKWGQAAGAFFRSLERK